jgi:hypothetical protein
MSGFFLIPSGVLSGPDIADNPGVWGKMTHGRPITFKGILV